MDPAISCAFHATATLQRSDVFDDDRLMPKRCTENAQVAAPGWVGSRWSEGGTVLVGINPGGGGDNYQGNSQDARLYTLIRTLRDAVTLEAQTEALGALSEAWIAIQRSHNIRRLFDAVREALGTDESRLAFVNVLPFRTREDKPARKVELRRAWEKGTGQQVAALGPSRLVALGCKAHDALLAAGADKAHEIVLLKRAIGDSRVTPEARLALEQLRKEVRAPS